MFDLLGLAAAEGRQEERQGRSARYMQSQRFIPPTHPAYVITSHFEAAHIVALQQEFDRNFIAMGMQTGKKKLMRIPDTPYDRYFIITDDSAGPTLLEGEFLTLTSKVVAYPQANCLSQVIQAFKEYIGLGHYQTSEQYYQNNEHTALAENRQATVLIKSSASPMHKQSQEGLQALVSNLGRNDVVTSGMSVCKASKIELREVSSLQVDSKIATKGNLYVYDNRKDRAQYKELVGQLRARYSSAACIKFIERIDQYNNIARYSKQYDNIVLLSQYSFLNLSKYFLRYRSFVLFTDESLKMDLYSQKMVALATGRKENIFAFVGAFIQQRGFEDEQAEGEGQAEHKRKATLEPALEMNHQKQPLIASPPNSPHFSANKVEPNVKPLLDRAKQQIAIAQLGSVPNRNSAALNSISPISTEVRPKIHLVRVTDLDKNKMKELKSKLKTSPIEDQNKTDASKLNKENKSTISPDLMISKPQRYIVSPQIVVPQHKIQLKIPPPQQMLSQNTPNLMAQVPITKKGNKQEDHLSNLIIAGNLHDVSFDNRSQQTKKSKIKRIKSNRRLDADYPPYDSLFHHDGRPSQMQAMQLQKSLTGCDTQRRPAKSAMMSHLRMGSDNHHSRGKHQPKVSHQRTRSDNDDVWEETPEIKVSTPKESSSELNQYYQMQPGEDIDENYEPSPPCEQGRSSQNQLSIRLPPSSKQKPSQQLKGSLFSSNPCPEQNFMTSIPKSGQKQQGSNHKIMKKQAIIEPNNDKAMNCKPKQPFPIKLQSKSPQKDDQNMLIRSPKPHLTQKKPTATDDEDLIMVRKPKPHHTVTLKSNSKLQEQKKEGNSIEASFMVQQVGNKELELQRLKDRMKVCPDQDYLAAMPTASFHHRKVVKANIIPPTFQTINNSQSQLRPIPEIEESINHNPGTQQHCLSNISSNLQSNIGNGIQIAGMSNISSIKPKRKSKTLESSDKGKRFTFGIAHESNLPKVRQLDARIPEQPNLAIDIENAPQNLSRSSLRPNKSKSQSQVHRVFNKYKLKPAQHSNQQLERRNDPYQLQAKDADSNKRPVTSRQGNPRVGKIYSQLKCKAANSKFDQPQASYDSNITSPKASRISSHRRPSDGSYDQKHPNKGIEDLIDLSKYDKVIENGVTVYRSKFPILVTQYSPPKLQPLPNAHPRSEFFKEISTNIPDSKAISSISNKPTINKKNEIGGSEDPYLLNIQHPKQQQQTKRPQKENMLRRSKSGATPLVRCSPGTKKKTQINAKNNQQVTPSQQNVGVQCEADPFNSLVNANNQQLITTIQNHQKENMKASKVSPYDPKRKIAKSIIRPIQDLLASKVSNSNNQSPRLILNMQSPVSRIDDVSQVSGSQSDSQSIHSGQDERLILYLMDKSQSNRLLEELSGVTSRKDSLLTFKNEKQLAQQLLQTVNIYDIVYVIPLECTQTVEKIAKGQKNCYIVQITDGNSKTKIKGNKVTLSSFKYLNDVSQLLLKQVPIRRAEKKHKRPYCSPSPRVRTIQESRYCFSPNATYFVPNCACLSRSACNNPLHQELII